MRIITEDGDNQKSLMVDEEGNVISLTYEIVDLS